MRLNLVDAGEDAVPRAKADDNFGYAQEESLDPVLHELAMEVLHVIGPPDLGRGLELDPVDSAALLFGFGIPD